MTANVIQQCSHSVSVPPPRPRASGFRISAGILGIILGIWLMFQSIGDGFSYGGSITAAVALCLLSGLGCFTTGIVLLARCASVGRGAPVTFLVFGCVALLAALFAWSVSYFSLATVVLTLVPVGAAVILMGMGLAREGKRRPERRH